MSGIKLDGDRLMRKVYVDESGISSKEAVTVVAGVIVNPDRQWKLVEQYIQELIEEFVPEKHRDGFVFHATELFHGSGKVFDRRLYPRDRAHEALRNLLAIPLRLRLPVVYGLNDKTAVASFEKPFIGHHRRIAALYQAFAYALCIAGVERYMREYADPSELAEVLSEKSEGAEKAVAAVHNYLKGREFNQADDVKALFFLRSLVSEYIPLRKIIDCVSYGAKEDAIPLQIADAYAFIIRCFVEKKPAAEPFYDVIGYSREDLLPGKEHKAGTIILPF